MFVAKTCCPTSTVRGERTGPRSNCTTPEYSHTTKVLDWHRDSGNNPVTAGGLIPYVREAPPYPGAGGCPADPASCGLFVANNNAAPCGAWRAQGSNDTADGGMVACSGTTSASADRNCYALSGNLITTPQSIGYKNLQAEVQWYGKYGWDSEYWAAPIVNDTDGLHPTTCIPERLTADQTKYRTLAVTGDWNWIEEDGTTTGSGSADQTTSVAQQTGILTSTGSAAFDLYAQPLGDLYIPEDYSFMKTMGQMNINSVYVHFSTRLQVMIDDVNAAPATLYMVYASKVWTMKRVSDNLNAREIAIDVAAGTFRESGYGIYDLSVGMSTWQVTSEVTVSVGSTLLNWNSWAKTIRPFAAQYVEFDGNATLSNTYMSSTVYAACQTLLSSFPIGDDISYPWRRDGFLSVAPLVTYAQVPETVIPTTDLVLPYTDTNASRGYDGTVMGRPSGCPGANSFSWDHKTYGFCGGADFIHYYGAWNGTQYQEITDLYVPLTATNWTNNKDATSLFPGRFVTMFNGGIRIQDWREQSITTKHQSWARPCGNDAYIPDETTVRCIDSATGPDSARVFTLFTAYGGAVSDLIVVIDTTDGGLWTVDAISGLDVTAHKTGSLPATFSYSDPGPLLGKRRYPTAGACNSTYNSTAPDGSFLKHAWTFNHRDYSERDRVIALADANCPAAGAAIRSHQAGHGMPQSVSAYAVTQYDAGSADTTNCLRTLTPEAFPGSITADERFTGVLWQSTVQQWMPEIYWKTPHDSCEAVTIGGSYNWHEDGRDSTWCHGDGPVDSVQTYWYPQRPWVEAQLAKPTGAPSLPADVVVGFYSLSDLDTAGAISGKNIGAPATIASSNNVTPGWEITPWSIFIGECSCISSELRFAAEYAAYQPYS